MILLIYYLICFADIFEISSLSVASFVIRQRIEKQRHYFADKGLYSQSYGFSSSQVWMWELDCK